jgi:hypothetical protein
MLPRPAMPKGAAMPKRPPPEPTPLAVLIPPIVARAMEGPRPPAEPEDSAPAIDRDAIRPARTSYLFAPEPPPDETV